MHYYQHHIGDFIKATARLTDAQSMAYLRLLWMYYDSEKPVPDDIDVLSMQVGLPVEELSLILRAYFKLENSTWNHTRCDQEIADYHSFLEKKSNAGKASAERRKNNSSTGVQHVSNNSSSTEQLTTNQQPLTNNHKPNTKTMAVKRPEDVDQDVWNDFLAIRKAKRAVLTQTALDGIQREASKAGWSLNDAIRETVARGWQSFKADWVAEKQVSSRTTQISFAQQERELGWKRWEEMTGREHPDRLAHEGKRPNQFIEIQATDILEIGK